MIKSKLDLTDVSVYDKSTFKPFITGTSSKGNVTKYTNGKLWIKMNYLGYESLAEVISSRVVNALGFKTVHYEPCFFSRNEYEVESACVSSSFTYGKNEYCIGRLLQSYGGYVNSDEMFNAFQQNTEPSLRIEWLLNTLAPLGITEYLRYSLAELIWLDSVLLNEDRHLFNLILVKDSVDCYQLVNFDYGASLLSDLRDYPMAMPLQRAIYGVKSKPFSTRFSSQLKAFQDYLPKNFSRSVTIDVSDLYSYFEAEYIERCIDVLALSFHSKGIAFKVIKDKANETSFFSSC